MYLLHQVAAFDEQGILTNDGQIQGCTLAGVNKIQEGMKKVPMEVR
jgi:hypothetical protein